MDAPSCTLTLQAYAVLNEACRCNADLVSVGLKCQVQAVPWYGVFQKGCPAVHLVDQLHLLESNDGLQVWFGVSTACLGAALVGVNLRSAVPCIPTFVAVKESVNVPKLLSAHRSCTV